MDSFDEYLFKAKIWTARKSKKIGPEAIKKSGIKRQVITASIRTNEAIKMASFW